MGFSSRLRLLQLCVAWSTRSLIVVPVLLVLQHIKRHLVRVADELGSAALGLSAVRRRLESDFAACRLGDSPNSALWYPESWEI
ncbi:MAG: hypothetical protein C1943_15695 [Halochromatium sp.]|nr:hypothetical protein [Halochromatium sp.]